MHGGSSINCSDPAYDPGEYGRFHVSWDGSSPQRRLKDWLDPLNTNQSYLDGIGTAIEPKISGIKNICSTNPATYTLENGLASFWIANGTFVPIGASNINLGEIMILNATNSYITIRAIITEGNHSTFV